MPRAKVFGCHYHWQRHCCIEFVSFSVDVVAGARTPVPVSDLRHQMPGVYDQLCTIEKKLERHYRDMQVKTMSIYGDPRMYNQS